MIFVVHHYYLISVYENANNQLDNFQVDDPTLESCAIVDLLFGCQFYLRVQELPLKQWQY